MKTISVYFILFLFLMSCLIISMPESEAIDTSYYQRFTTTFDSYLYNDSNTWHNSSNLLITNYTIAPPPLPTRRIITEWDITSISDEATITQVAVRFYLVQGTSSVLTRNYMYSIENQPSVNNFTTVFDDCADGSLIVDSLTDFDGPAGWKNISYAGWNSRLQGNLSGDWFALGWMADESGANSDNDNVTMYSMEESGGAYAIELHVWYTTETVEIGWFDMQNTTNFREVQSGWFVFGNSSITHGWFSFGDIGCITEASLEPSFDTYLLGTNNTWWNTTNEGGFGTTNMLYAYDATSSSYLRRMAIEWNTSSIPDIATITNVSLRFYVTDTFITSNQYAIFTKFENQPSINNFTTIYGDYSNTVDLYDTDYASFDNTGWRNETLSNESGMITDLQNQLVDDWFSVGVLLHVVSGAHTNNIAMYSVEQSGYGCRLIVSYTTNQPILENPYPSNNSSGINVPVTTSIDYDHCDPTTTTLNWSIYINSTSSWYQYASDSVSSAQTLSHVLPSNISTLQQTYWWRINATNSFGNSTVVIYHFTLGGANPPTNVVCTRNGSTGITLSFDKMDNASGLSYTVCYYREGSVPPNWGEGTLGGNVTDEIIEITGLDEETCYIFSLWTNFYDNVSEWTRSSSRTIEPSCCTSGRNYTIFMRYENTSYASGLPVNELINLSQFNDSSTHRLTVIYTNGTQEHTYYNSTNFANDTSHANYTYQTIQTNSSVLAFELWWNYLSDDCNTNNSYRRRLLPASADDGGNLTFYLMTDAHIVDEYYYDNCTATYHSYFNDSLAQYIYQFVDSTALFTGQSGYYSYATIWKVNATGIRINVHQDYIDMSDRLYLTLLSGDRNYHIGINSSYVSDGYLYENIGYAPTGKDIDPDYYELVIKPRSVDILPIDFGSLFTTRWLSGGTGFYVYYYDETLSTEIINCTITREDTGNVVYQHEVDNIEYTFNFSTASQDYVYIINLTVTLTNGQSGSFVYAFSVSMGEIFDPNYIDDTMEEVFGQPPSNPDTGEETQYHTFFIFAGGLVFFGIFATKNPALAGFGVGLWLIGSDLMLGITANNIGTTLIPLGSGILIVVVLYKYLTRGDKE